MAAALGPRPITAVTIGFAHAGLAEYLAHLGFRFVVIDGEHGPIDDDRIEQVVMGAALGGAATILRAPPDLPGLQRYLDMGVSGLQIPHLQSLEDIRSVIDAIMYRPTGHRGLGAGRAMRYGLFPGGIAGYADAANSNVLIIVQVEDDAGLSCLEEVARIPEVGVILAGPLDLSDNFGVRGRVSDSRVRDAMHRIVETARSANKIAGLPAKNADEAAEAIAAGAEFILTSVPALLNVGATPLLAATGYEREPR